MGDYDVPLAGLDADTTAGRVSGRRSAHAQATPRCHQAQCHARSRAATASLTQAGASPLFGCRGATGVDMSAAAVGRAHGSQSSAATSLLLTSCRCWLTAGHPHQWSERGNWSQGPASSAQDARTASRKGRHSFLSPWPPCTLINLLLGASASVVSPALITSIRQSSRPHQSVAKNCGLPAVAAMQAVGVLQPSLRAPGLLQLRPCANRPCRAKVGNTRLPSTRAMLICSSGLLQGCCSGLLTCPACAPACRCR